MVKRVTTCCISRMLLFGSKITRVKSNEHPEVLLVVQDQTCLSLHQTLNRLESEFSPQLSIRSVKLQFISKLNINFGFKGVFRRCKLR